jgi:hypothetical protein
MDVNNEEVQKQRRQEYKEYGEKKETWSAWTSSQVKQEEHCHMTNAIQTGAMTLHKETAYREGKEWRLLE